MYDFDRSCFRFAFSHGLICLDCDISLNIVTEIGLFWSL